LTDFFFWVYLHVKTFIHQKTKKEMTKKEFMLQVIEFLPDWKMGWGLKALIENDQLSPEVFERLYEVFRKSVHQTYNEVQKQQLKERIQQVNSMQQHESQKKEEDLADLDAMFTAL